MWDHRYNRTADWSVVEGPEAGGHGIFQGFSWLTGMRWILTRKSGILLHVKRNNEEKFGREIPVVVAGGIFDRKDIDHAMALGADGVQIASRFVADKGMRCR